MWMEYEKVMSESAKRAFRSASLERLASSLEQASGDDVQALHDAIELFNQHTQELRDAYDALRARVAEVDRELEEKNRHLEQQVREIQRLKGDLDEIIESMDSGLIAVDTEGIVFTFNGAAERALGLDRQLAIGRTLPDVLSTGGRSIHQALVERNSGTLEIAASVAQGQTAYLRGTVSPLFDREGQARGATFIFTDLTSQRLLEERARRADRMAALGELAAGVAHEMRNPLTTIRGYLQMLPNFRDDASFIQEFSDNLIREIDRLTRLTNDLLSMAKPKAKHLQVIDLGELMANVVEFLSERAKQAGVELSLERQDIVNRVAVDSDRIKQVFINLIVNAIEASGTGGWVRLRLKRSVEQVDAEGRRKTFVVADVYDNGGGIPNDQIARIFDPFFTTKPSGTGLGLALSSRIAEEHDGLVRVESEEGKGSTFSLLLPLVEES